MVAQNMAKFTKEQIMPNKYQTFINLQITVN